MRRQSEFYRHRQSFKAVVSPTRVSKEERPPASSQVDVKTMQAAAVVAGSTLNDELTSELISRNPQSVFKNAITNNQNQVPTSNVKNYVQTVNRDSLSMITKKENINNSINKFSNIKSSYSQK
jgi:hypothetical protein